jgi:hypothetical protein
MKNKITITCKITGKTSILEYETERLRYNGGATFESVSRWYCSERTVHNIDTDCTCVKKIREFNAKFKKEK